MIYALKHKSGKYIKGVQGLVFQPDIRKKKIKLILCENLKDARMVEDPNMDNVYMLGLDPIPLEMGKLKPKYRIYNEV